MTERLPPNLRWVGFDLDDTLHDFGRASKRAAEAAFAEIEPRLGLEVSDLEAAYREILRAVRASRFTAAKTAREYRAERFGALLRGFGVDPGPRLEHILNAYDSALAEALELKPGARDALTASKRAGLRAMVVSEGPHDAKATTIERLGIAPTAALGIANVYVGGGELPEDSSAIRLDLPSLARLLDRLARV